MCAFRVDPRCVVFLPFFFAFMTVVMTVDRPEFCVAFVFFSGEVGENPEGGRVAF